MKKISGFIFVAVSMILFSACQKELSSDNLSAANSNNNNNNSNTDFKIRKYRESVTSTAGNFSQTFNLSYDANNRILSLVDSTDPATKFVYTYNSGNVYTMELFNVGMLSIHEEFFLNSVPLIDSTFQYNDTGDTIVEKNIYDAANHIIQLKEYDYTTAGGAQLFGTYDYTYDVDGNIIQEIDTNAGSVTTYQYYTDLNTIDVGKPYEPKNKNLTKKTIIVDGSSTVTVDYTYTYDSLNRVTSETAQYSTGDVVVRSYSY